MKSKYEDFSINTIFGPGTHIAGDVETGGFTRIDGSMQGNLSARGRIVVGEKARLKSNISGTTIVVGGIVYGNILASEGIVVLASGMVMGDVITRKIQADEGCLIHGRIVVCRTEELWQAAVVEYRDVQGVKAALSGFTTVHG